MPKFNMYQSLHTTVIGPDGQAGRDPDPHPRDAPRRRVRHRRALEVQGAGARGNGVRRRSDTEMAWLRQLLDWQKETADPGEFLESLRFDLYADEVFVFTPKGDVDRSADRRDAGRLRLRGPHRGRPPLHRRPGQRPARAARDARSTTATSVEIFTSKAAGAGPSRDWLTLRQDARGPATRSGSGSPRSAARRRSSTARTRIARRCASRACRSSGCWRRVAADAGPGAALPRRLRAVRRGRRGPRVGAARSSSGSSQSLGGDGGRDRGPRRGRHADAATRAARVDRRPGRRRQGRDRHLGQAGPLLHAGARATRSSASSPAAAACRCTAPTASTPTRCVEAAGPAGRGRVGAVGQRRCSWSRSRSRRSTGPACSPTSPGCCPTST